MTTGKKFDGKWNYVDSKDVLRLQDEYINYMQQGQEKYYKGIKNQLSAMELENKKHIAEIVKWFTGRMIKQDVLNAMGIVSVKEWMPQFQKEVECIRFRTKRMELLLM